MSRPIEIIRKVCPRARASYLAAIEAGDGLFKAAGITTPLRLAHFLAQICHESGSLTIEWESGNYKAARILEIFGEGKHSAKVTPAEAERLAGNGPALFERVYGLGNPRKKDLGNTEPGDGWRYRGGGLMQTTGRANYRRMGQKCGVDFETHPELVLSAAHALKPALAEWAEGNLNVAADRNDIRAITKRINGGFNGLADREAWLARIHPLIDVVTLTGAPVPVQPEMQKPIESPPVSKDVGKIIVGTGSATAVAWYAGLSTEIIIAAAIVALAAVVAFIAWSRRK